MRLIFFSDQTSLFYIDHALCVRIGDIAFKDDILRIHARLFLEDGVSDRPGEDFGRFPSQDDGSAIVEIGDHIGDKVGTDAFRPVKGEAHDVGCEDADGAGGDVLSVPREGGRAE